MSHTTYDDHGGVADMLKSVVGKDGDQKTKSSDLSAELALERAANKATHVRDALMDFRERFRLKDRAKYPSSHIMHASVLAGIVLVEGLANAYFFSKGSDLGLLGGWLQAITVSFTNVIAAFWLIGFLGMRNASLKGRYFSQAVGGFFIALGVVSILALNLSAAHFRDMLEFQADALALAGVNGENPILDPVNAMRAYPFEIQTLEALLLLILGSTFAAIAAWKGYTFDDPQPGYTRHARHAEKVAEELVRAYDVAAKKLAGRNDGALEEAKYALLELDAAINCKLDENDFASASGQQA